MAVEPVLNYEGVSSCTVEVHSIPPTEIGIRTSELCTGPKVEL